MHTINNRVAVKIFEENLNTVPLEKRDNVEATTWKWHVWASVHNKQLKKDGVISHSSSVDAYRQYIKSFKSRIGWDNNWLQQDRAWQIIGTIEQKWQHFHFFMNLFTMHSFS